MKAFFTSGLVLSVIVACSGSSSSDSAASAVEAERAAAASQTAAVARVEAKERANDTLQTVGVSAAVADVGTYSEDLYDQIKASNWSKASTLLKSLESSASQMSTDEQGKLDTVLTSLREAVSRHQLERALETVNKATLIAAGLTERYHPTMPADIVRLDYYGRELEIWSARNNMSKLAETVAEIKRTWNAVKPEVVSHGGTMAAERTDKLVAQLSSASSPEAYARIATPFLDVVDELEKPFEK